MKRFLIVFLLAFVVSIPTAIVKAADVPSFYNVGDRYLTLTDREDTAKGYRLYTYECDVNLTEDFAEQFTQILVSKYHFRLNAHFVNDYEKDQSAVFETWCFIYTGSKQISQFDTTNYEDMQTYSANLLFFKNKDWQTGKTIFWLYVADGLTYAED